MNEPTQQAFEDIEIRIFRSSKKFVGELSCADGKFSCDLEPPPCEEVNQEMDVKRYGEQLFAWLFQKDLFKQFRRIRWESEAYSANFGGSVPSLSRLRLRLWLDPQSPELHRLWWEAMRDPSRDEPVSLDAAFSRFLRVNRARGWPVTERPLRMLSIFSNPKGLERFNLAGFDVSLEKNLLGSATESIKQFLDFQMLSDAPTLDNLREELGKGYHIVHLVAHAVKAEGRHCLLLADGNGSALPVPFEQLIEILKSAVEQAPYFIFLNAPTTADEQVGETLVNFAPQLVQAGAQAVLAVQAALAPERLTMFTERFYNTLIRTGTVDLAMTVARSASYSHDWQWVYPVLYMRTPDAQLFQPMSEAQEATLKRIAGALRSVRKS